MPKDKSNDILSAVRKEFETLKAKTPPKTRSTKRQQILELRDEIRQLLSQGWSVKDIAEAMTKGGLEITAAALKNQLYILKKELEPKKESKKESTQVLSHPETSETPPTTGGFNPL